MVGDPAVGQDLPQQVGIAAGTRLKRFANPGAFSLPNLGPLSESRVTRAMHAAPTQISLKNPREVPRALGDQVEHLRIHPRNRKWELCGQTSEALPGVRFGNNGLGASLETKP